MNKARGRTQRCTKDEARRRFVQSRKLLEVAELCAEESEHEYANVAAALAVLAGIAASDAATCAAMGQRSRSADHHDAEILVDQIVPDGATAANKLRRLLNRKDDAHYGFFDVGAGDLRGMLRQARDLVVFAERTIGA